ncbi:MAG TPA: ABC transporter ATP-binding protein, partial [Bacillota bacterium]|nr:ABC transporter ATP-binding protein [Bacillota bacterium]
RRGEVHALLGENGAGKTTLMKILYGLYKPDSGVIRLHGKTANINSPEQAIRHGIGMVHQHFMLIPPFTVHENIILGCEPKKSFGRINYTQAFQKIRTLSETLGLKIDPKAKVSDISVGLQQRVEILKALYREADILILDEPTSVLTPQEADELGLILRKLVAEGKAVVFITHKLKEVMKFTDRITVIRRGRTVATVSSKTATVESLAEMMVGRKLLLEVTKKPLAPGEVLFQAEGLWALSNQKLPALKNINFTVRAGEILAFAGVDGNGQSELIEVLTGLRPLSKGKVFLNAEEITGLGPRDLLRKGLSHIPEDRQKRGLILDFTIWENLVLESYRESPFSHGGFLQEKTCREYAGKLVKEFDIRTPSVTTPVAALSGGNQQKAVVAREIRRNPKVLIVAQPTRGLDVGAIEFVHHQILAERDSGKAILLFSLELDEILALADRILVIYEGEIVGSLAREFATEEQIGLMMTGAAKMDTGSGGVCQ